METLFQNVLTASFHGSIVIAAVLVLRLALRKTPKKFLCLLWLLVGIRLLMPFEIRSSLSLQPQVEDIPYVAEVRQEGRRNTSRRDTTKSSWGCRSRSLFRQKNPRKQWTGWI